MNQTSPLLADSISSHSNANEIVRTHRERLAMEENARAQQRRLELAEQRSDRNSPEVRIRAWEKLHGLRLPSGSAHPILEVIASGTRLTLAQVQEEQRARQAERTASAQKPNSTA